MGYRHYFHKVDKEVLEFLHNCSEEEYKKWAKKNQLMSDNDLPRLRNIGETFFEFGKYYDNANSIMKMGKPLFGDETLTEAYEEETPCIVGPEGVLDAIQHYRSKVIKHHEDLLSITKEEDMPLERLHDDLTPEQRYKRDIESRYEEWKDNLFLADGQCMALDLNPERPGLTHSWKYEYAIFDLVRLYKDTDWNTYGLIFMGW